MPNVVRLGDALLPHECWTPHVMASGSGNVLTNGIPTCRIGDSVTIHCHPCVPGVPCHTSVQSSGSPNVIINGMPVARVGDNIACGSTNRVGSGNVIAN